MSTFKEIPASKGSIAKRKSAFGVGINDASYIVKPVVNGVRFFCPYYFRWEKMLARCYSNSSLRKNPTYIGCTVCDEWLIFSNFKEWMIKQDWQGKHLDKDIINPGNKVYSSDNCAFVPCYVNNVLLDSRSARGDYPIGVYLHAQCGRFASKVNYKGKTISLGLHSTPEGASKAYIKKKVEIMLLLAPEQVDERVADGLVAHANILLGK